MSTQWDDATPWNAAAWHFTTTEGWRQNQQHSEEVAAALNFQAMGRRSMELSRVGPHDSADAMDGSLQVDLPLDNREVLVDHQTYTIPMDHTQDTWAKHELKQPYVIWVTAEMLCIGGKTGWWCRLCGKWAECKSHFGGKDHLTHVFQPSKLSMDRNLWKIPKTVEQHQQEQQQQQQQQQDQQQQQTQQQKQQQQQQEQQ